MKTLCKVFSDVISQFSLQSKFSGSKNPSKGFQEVLDDITVVDDVSIYALFKIYGRYLGQIFIHLWCQSGQEWFTRCIHVELILHIR